MVNQRTSASWISVLRTILELGFSHLVCFCSKSQSTTSRILIPSHLNISELSPFYSSSDTSIVSVIVEPSSSKKDPYLKVRSAALNLYGPTYSFDGLLDVSRPAFHQPSFQGFKPLRRPLDPLHTVNLISISQSSGPYQILRIEE
jgi:hypothetical protein